MKLVEKCGNVLNPVIYEADTPGTIEKVIDGTVTVEISGDSCTIILESSNINARYVGAFAL